jgi:hypothetical protein
MRSPKSKEGCRVTPRQGKLCTKALKELLGQQYGIKHYCMAKRLILKAVK